MKSYQIIRDSELTVVYILVHESKKITFCAFYHFIMIIISFDFLKITFDYLSINILIKKIMQ